MKVHTLNIDSSQRDVTIYPNSNNYVITLENPIYHVEEIRLISARIPTPQTPVINSLILRLSSGSDELNQSVYVGKPKGSSQTGTPHYTGHILLDGTTNITFNGNDDPLIHRFHSGPQKIIKNIGIEFLYMNSGVLTRYRFNNQNHVLKFEIKCSTDKLEGLTKVPLDTFTKKEITEKIKNPATEILYNQEVYMYIGIILCIGMVLMFLMKGKPISEK
tara:strand:- start:1364 stop:2017 length:654 start_codon:yes stop_codon:yes gene_type:complete